MREHELFVCIDEDNNLHSIEWDKERNKEQKEISLCGSEYDNCINEETGEEEAEDRLSSSDYWEDMGMLPENSFLSNFIDFEEVAEHVISNDGWENTCGEYQYFGDYDKESFYFNLQSCGQHDDFRNRKIKRWLIPKEEAEKLLKIWDKYHIQKITETKFKEVF